MDIGKRIKEARKHAGLTQAQLAEEMGLATITIRQYELGKRQPRIEQLFMIADILQLEPAYFMDDRYETPEEARKALKQQDIIFNAMKAGDFGTVEEIMGLERGTIGKPDEQRKQEILAEMAAERALLKRLKVDFHKLNEKGQRIATERVEELTHIPAYQKHKN